MDRDQALELLERKGILLESGRGPVPNLADEVADEQISGSWWGHPAGEEIFLLTRAMRASEDVLVCRLVDGKITYVHRRLWPALVALSDRFERDRLAAVSEAHTQKGHHETEETPFPDWVPADVERAARRHPPDEAEEELRAALGDALPDA